MTTDHSDLTIEDDAMLDRINLYERAASHHRRDALSYRTTARSWRDFPVGDPSEADAFARLNDTKAAGASGFEGRFLGQLNAVLLGVSTVGQTWEINDSIYRVVTDGNPCVRLVCTLPVDEPDTDPEWSDRDEQAEKMAHYSQMVRVGQL